MADVFISYKSERRPAARHLGAILEAHGFTVWFDYHLPPGKDFGRLIEREVRTARAVVVLWCPLSVDSVWVAEEADLAKQLGTILPARIASCEPPLGFRRIDFVDIIGWDGDPSTRSLDRLITHIEILVGRKAVINRDKLVSLHETWVAHGRPTLAQFTLVKSSEVGVELPRLPGNVALPPQPTSTEIPAVVAGVTQEKQPLRWAKWVLATLIGMTGLMAILALTQNPGRFGLNPPPATQPGNLPAQSAERSVPVTRCGEAEVSVDLASSGPECLKRLATFKDRFLSAGQRVNGPSMIVVPKVGDGNFAVGRSEVTFAEWDAAQADPSWKSVTGADPRLPNDYDWKRDQQPVIDVSFEDATNFTLWLSKATGRRYRLLTDAEWQHVAEAGRVTEYPTGDFVTANLANYDARGDVGSKGSRRFEAKPLRVGSYSSNHAHPWGLFDLAGNVAEWVQGCFDAASKVSNPATGPCHRMLRGGSWQSKPQALKNMLKMAVLSKQDQTIGFRIARDLE